MGPKSFNHFIVAGMIALGAAGLVSVNGSSILARTVMVAQNADSQQQGPGPSDGAQNRNTIRGGDAWSGDRPSNNGIRPFANNQIRGGKPIGGDRMEQPSGSPRIDTRAWKIKSDVHSGAPEDPQGAVPIDKGDIDKGRKDDPGGNTYQTNGQYKNEWGGQSGNQENKPGILGLPGGTGNGGETPSNGGIKPFANDTIQWDGTQKDGSAGMPGFGAQQGMKRAADGLSGTAEDQKKATPGVGWGKGGEGSDKKVQEAGAVDRASDSAAHGIQNGDSDNEDAQQRKMLKMRHAKIEKKITLVQKKESRIEENIAKYTTKAQQATDENKKKMYEAKLQSLHQQETAIEITKEQLKEDLQDIEDEIESLDEGGI